MNEELDSFYEELEYIDLLEIKELGNTDSLAHYHEEYMEYEQDLTDLIRSKK